jgi:pyridoxal phosphate enzyme (YggS family)
MIEATIADRVVEIRQRMAAAAARAGRAPRDVTLLAAAKTRSPAEIDAAVAAGVDAVGHNYVQEAAATRPLVTRAAPWRLIGALQRNKAALAAGGLFEAVDTVDRAALADSLSRRREEAGLAPLEVLIEVHLGDEASKAGVGAEEAEALLAHVQLLPGLKCLGVMTLPPPGEAQAMRPWFAALAVLAERLRAASGLPLPVVSMGMSGDYEVAIEEGATLVRLGTVLFGPRDSVGATLDSGRQ